MDGGVIPTQLAAGECAVADRVDADEWSQHVRMLAATADRISLSSLV
jgi:hypothetical protein